MSQALRLDNWMQDLAASNPSVRNWKLSKFIIPGTHNSGTFGHGTKYIENNWKCQDWSFATQLLNGVRYFDLRLGWEKDANWWPCHGIAYETADVLARNRGVDEDPSTTLLGQIKKFVIDHPQELVIICLDANTTKAIDNLWLTIMNALQQHLIPAPLDDADVPTWQDMVDMQRSILVVSQKTRQYQPVMYDISAKWQQYVWPSADSSFEFATPAFWLSDAYTDAGWQVTDPSIPAEINKTYMIANAARMKGRDVFWNAQCQLTPTFGSSRWLENHSYSPRDLAEIANKYTREHIVTDELWKAEASVLTFDFPSVELIEDVVGMNLR